MTTYLLKGTASVTGRYRMMEKDPIAHHGNSLQQSRRLTRVGILAKVLLAVLVIVSFISIFGKSIDGVVTRYFGNRPRLPSNIGSASSEDEFRLVSVHRSGVGKHRNKVYQILDIPPESEYHLSSFTDSGRYIIPSMVRKTTHLADLSRQSTESYITQSRLYKQALRDPFTTFSPQSPSALWITRDITVPNVTAKTTVTTLAKISANAYVRIPETEGWYDIGHKWNMSTDFGWEENGLRGHVFANSDNSTILVAMKGTSPPYVGGSDTSTNDRINDNILFSCCCARVSYLWATVCDCYTGEAYKCNLTCLENEVVSEDHYYHTALNIYYNVTAQYPNATIWLTGHSLGGALASLVGLTFGMPTITFESPPERLASQRLHLPSPPALKPEDRLVWHFGHTADPIYMGICTGPSSSCWYAGFAMESTCHTGFECVYDSVTDLGWRVSLSNHRIIPVINDILERYNDTAKCAVVEDCVDCYQWEWVD